MKNPEAVKKWVEALRSGEFKQAQEVLHDKTTGGFCCLGVACVIAKREGVIPKEARWSIRDQGFPSEPALQLDRQFEPVRKWLGLKTAEGDFGEQSERKGLARMNDGGASFSEIADMIESEPEGLFE